MEDMKITTVVSEFERALISSVEECLMFIKEISNSLKIEAVTDGVEKPIGCLNANEQY